LQPVYVAFGVQQTALHQMIKHQAKGATRSERLFVGRELLEKGKLTVINNQVSTTTGTVTLQAYLRQFRRRPSQCVSVQLVVGMLRNLLTVSASAAMLGANGDYVYIINTENKVKRLNIQQGACQGRVSVISSISAWQKMVAAGQARLNKGTLSVIQQATVWQQAAPATANARSTAPD
jgi:multidrug efflux system membrane fusion protein